jgi:hypothetical protein
MRRPRSLLLAALLGGVAVLPVTASALELKVHTSDDPALKMAAYTFQGGKTLTLRVGVGSAAFHGPNDAAGVIWTVSDRGPQFTCEESPPFTGLTVAQVCGEIKGGRVYPVPGYNPAIFKLQMKPDGTFAVLETITLKDQTGKPLTGLVNPLTKATTETPVDGTGKKIDSDIRSTDNEGLVRLADGTFWIGEENAPSIVHVAADGRILHRYVPAGSEDDFKTANYPVSGTLPAILVKRQSNRGIESLTMSPDEQFIYFLVQNPLANPDAAAYRDASNTRLYKMERATLKLVGEYVYVLDKPQTFRHDASNVQSTVRISELAAIGTDRLLVIERTDKTTKIHEIDLAGATSILGSKWDEVATAPSLEKVIAAESGIVPVKKTLRLDTFEHAEFPVKAEGIAVLGEDEIAVINDDDFGISGETTKIVGVRGAGIKLSK